MFATGEWSHRQIHHQCSIYIYSEQLQLMILKTSLPEKLSSHQNTFLPTTERVNPKVKSKLHKWSSNKRLLIIMDTVDKQEIVNKETFVEMFQVNIYYCVLKISVKFSDKLIMVWFTFQAQILQKMETGQVSTTN